MSRFTLPVITEPQGERLVQAAENVVIALASIADDLRAIRELMNDNAAVNGPGLFEQSNQARSPR